MGRNTPMVCGARIMFRFAHMIKVTCLPWQCTTQLTNFSLDSDSFAPLLTGTRGFYLFIYFVLDYMYKHCKNV